MHLFTTNYKIKTNVQINCKVHSLKCMNNVCYLLFFIYINADMYKLEILYKLVKNYAYL